jgi:hypothetical protein
LLDTGLNVKVRMKTPNPKGFPTGFWPDDIETPAPWELAHWSWDRVAEWFQKRENAKLRREAKEQRRKSLLLTL